MKPNGRSRCRMTDLNRFSSAKTVALVIKRVREIVDSAEVKEGLVSEKNVANRVSFDSSAWVQVRQTARHAGGPEEDVGIRNEREEKLIGGSVGRGDDARISTDTGEGAVQPTGQNLNLPPIAIQTLATPPVLLMRMQPLT
ncbi:unnamed protein product [Caenorhabditis auriculariae]|uniref:Uncharacterized protein n=1 Tax=Caenorhabditis auriculariae TaxID=2777116 RepID=A0A8S1GNT2_9PELO|nr:unnamed protein product [Caenorhabditis auriculariae]